MLKNPSPDTVKKALENVGETEDQVPITDVNVIEETDKSSGSSVGWVFFCVVFLAIGGGVYTFRHLTKPRPVGLPMLEGDNNDAYPINALAGSFFGGSGSREMQPRGASANGFTRF